MSECIGLPPSINPDCRRLILGSMPGIASLQEQQYYAHPHNRFWPLMATLLGENAVPGSYIDRLTMLLRHRIALWDSIGSCERTGSLDSAIKNEQANDFPGLLAAYPGIRKICFNGGKSFQTFKKHHKSLLLLPQIEFKCLPSTSPANARWQMPQLLAAWREALDN